MAKLSAIQAGNVIDGRYRITSTIGEGTFGTVYEAEHLQLHRRVAIKLLRHCDPAKLERFRREAEAISRISQENVVAIHDYRKLEDGRPYIVLDLIKGQDLAELFAKRKLKPEEAVHIGVSVLRALQAAHAEGIVHRDLKPSNVILGRSNDSAMTVKVVDFGLAKPLNEEGVSLTQTGDTIGTPQYMSPEQCRGMDLDGRSDIYGLGLILYEGLAGKPFVASSSLFDCMTKHVEGQEIVLPDDGSVPDDLANVVRKALAKERKDRYANAEEMMAALNAVRLRRKPKKKLNDPVKTAAISVALIACIGAGAVYFSGARRPASPPPTVKKDLKWKETQFGGIKFMAPKVDVYYDADKHELIQSYDIDPGGTNYIEVKQYPEANIFDEVKKQHNRHIQYPGFKPIKMLFPRAIGKGNKIQANESDFSWNPDPPAEERHVLFAVDACTYKFKLHATRGNKTALGIFEKMLRSVHR